MEAHKAHREEEPQEQQKRRREGGHKNSKRCSDNSGEGAKRDGGREGRISSQRWGQCFKATADAVVVLTKGKTRDSFLRWAHFHCLCYPKYRLLLPPPLSVATTENLDEFSRRMMVMVMTTRLRSVPKIYEANIRAQAQKSWAQKLLQPVDTNFN